MKRYSVIILAEAEHDIENAYLYIKEDSPQNALKWQSGCLRQDPIVICISVALPTGSGKRFLSGRYSPSDH